MLNDIIDKTEQQKTQVRAHIRKQTFCRTVTINKFYDKENHNYVKDKVDLEDFANKHNFSETDLQRNLFYAMLDSDEKPYMLIYADSNKVVSARYE